MLKVIQGFVLMAVLGLLALGCGTDRNPVRSPSGSGLTQNNPQSPSLLGNRVWHDVNKDGLQGDTLVEPGIAGVNVSLYTCADVKLSTVVTNGKGLYFFPMLPAGDYYIKFASPPGYVFTSKDAGPDSLDSDADPTTGRTDCFSLAVSTADLTWDAGLYEGQTDTVVNGTVGGRVWFDANQDGIQNESLLNDVMDSLAVELFTCADSLVATAMTDTAGEYHFADIIPGQYYLLFTLPMGYAFSPMDMTGDTLGSDPNPLTGKTDCFQVDSAEVELTWDAGIRLVPQSTGCTRSMGYWKNHAGFGPQENLITPLLPLWLGNSDGAASIAVTNARTAVDILQMKAYGDPSNGITKLYARLLTAKLNIAAGADGSAIAEIIGTADFFLGSHGWQSWKQLSRADRKQVLKWMSVLAQYNGGEIGPGACDEHIGDGHDHGDSDHHGDDSRDNGRYDGHDGGQDGGHDGGKDRH